MIAKNFLAKIIYYVFAFFALRVSRRASLACGP